MLAPQLLKQASELSRKPESIDDAWRLVEHFPADDIAADNRLDVAWILYRYLNKNHSLLDSTTCRRLLALYLSLADGKPSLLHSLCLKLAINCAKHCPDLNFYRFFIKWNPELLRQEDYVSDVRGDISYPCLATLALVRASGYQESQGLGALLKFVNRQLLNSTELLKVSRRRLCHQLASLCSDNGRSVNPTDLSRCIPLFEEYRRTLCKGPVSGHHSRALDYACRILPASGPLRFADFFRDWAAVGFRDDDWISQQGKDGKSYPGLAERALKIIFDTVKSDPRSELELARWALPLFEEGARRETSGHWMRYRYARMLLELGDSGKALDVLRSLRGSMAQSWFYWTDLADCTSEPGLQCALLCKAALTMRDNRFAAPLHLRLSRLFAYVGLKAEARKELDIAMAIREAGGHRQGARVEALANELRDVAPAADNSGLYRRYAAKANEFLFADVPWTDAVIDRLWKSRDGRDVARLRLADGREVICGQNRLRPLENAAPGTQFMVKVEPGQGGRLLMLRK